MPEWLQTYACSRFGLKQIWNPTVQKLHEVFPPIKVQCSVFPDSWTWCRASVSLECSWKSWRSRRGWLERHLATCTSKLVSLGISHLWTFVTWTVDTRVDVKVAQDTCYQWMGLAWVAAHGHIHAIETTALCVFWGPRLCSIHTCDLLKCVNSSTSFMDQEWFTLETAGTLIVGWNGGPVRLQTQHRHRHGHAHDAKNVAMATGSEQQHQASGIEIAAAAATGYCEVSFLMLFLPSSVQPFLWCAATVSWSCTLVCRSSTTSPVCHSPGARWLAKDISLWCPPEKLQEGEGKGDWGDAD